MDDHAVLAGPAREVVGHPGAHRGAVAVGARHADPARVLGEQVPPRGAVIGAVGQFGIDPLHVRIVLVAGHLLGEAEVLEVDLAAVERAPGGEQVGAPFGGEAGDRVRAEHALGQLIADADVIPPALAVAEIVEHLDPRELALFERIEFSVGPLGLLELGGVDRLGARRREIADRGRALLGDQLAGLVAVEVVPALEAGRAESGVLDAVVERDALVGDDLAAEDAGAIVPELVAAEQQVRVLDLADARRRGAVAVVHRDGEALRRDQAAPLARRGIGRVEVQQVGIVHRVHPAADVVVAERLAQRRAVDGLAEVLVDVRAIEGLVVGGHVRTPVCVSLTPR